MTLLDVVVVALIQGIAETLPLGAAGHLALILSADLPPRALAAVLAAAHAGLAVGLSLCLWRDIAAMAIGVARLTRGRLDPGGQLLINLALGTMPALAAGALLLFMGGGVGGIALAAAMLVVFGLLLLAADRLGVTVRRVEHMGWASAAVIGAVQVLALLPGVSRTGITITAARLMGYERAEAARFSLLLVIPLSAAQAGIIMAMLGQDVDLVLSADLAIAASIAGASSLMAACLLMAWLSRRGFMPFALWQIVLGGLMLATIL